MNRVIPTPASQMLDVPAHRFRWTVLLFAWAGLLLSTVCRLAWGALAIPVGQSLALPLAVLGVFVTAFYVGYVASNVVGGVITDRVGGRLTLSASLVGLALATYTFGYTPSLTIGLVLQCVMGLMAGADYASGVKLVATWFDKAERGRAVGVLMSASSVAVIVSNAFLPSIVAAWGWRDTYHALGILAVCLGVICAFVIRDRPDGSEVPLATHRPPMKSLLTRNFVLLALAGCGGFWGTLGFASWAISLMVKGHQMSAVQAGFVVAIAGVAGMLSKPTVGWLSDKLGGRRRALTIAAFTFFCAMLLVFGQLTSLMAFRIAAPFIGVAAFIYSPLLVTLVAEQSGLAMAGSAAGIANAFWQSGSAVAPVVVGVVFQLSHSLPAAFAALAVGPLFGAVCMLFVAEGRNEDNLEKKA